MTDFESRGQNLIFKVKTKFLSSVVKILRRAEFFKIRFSKILKVGQTSGFVSNTRKTGLENSEKGPYGLLRGGLIMTNAPFLAKFSSTRQRTFLNPICSSKLTSDRFKIRP